MGWIGEKIRKKSPAGGHHEMRMRTDHAHAARVRPARTGHEALFDDLLNGFAQLPQPVRLIRTPRIHAPGMCQDPVMDIATDTITRAAGSLSSSILAASLPHASRTVSPSGPRQRPARLLRLPVRFDGLDAVSGDRDLVAEGPQHVFADSRTVASSSITRMYPSPSEDLQ